MLYFSDAPVIVITGATHGIGLATARLCAKKGARVALLSRDPVLVRKAVDQLGDRTFGVSADVSNPADMRAAAKKVLARFGRVDGLVNNAGIWASGPFLSTSERDAVRLIEVDLLGVMNGCRSFLPQMLKQRHASIVNIGSTLALRGFWYSAAYSAAKFGVRGFTQGLRAELAGSGVSVSIVNPGFTATNLFSNDPEHALRNQRTGLKPDKPEKVAAAIVRALERGPAEVNVGAQGKALAAFERLSPRLMERFVLMLRRRTEKY